jgi:hypothetical protein
VRHVRARLAVSVVLVLAAVAIPVPASAAEGARLRKVPAAIPSDCSVDVTARLSTWLHKDTTRTVVRFRRNGCYRVDGTLGLRQFRHVTLDGNGATLQAVAEGDQARRHVWFQGGHDVVVRRLIVRGVNPNAGPTPQSYVPAKAFQHAFAFSGVARVRLRMVEAYSVYGDFVYIGRTGRDGPWSDDIRVTDSTFEGSGRQGIAITAGSNVVIARNTIRGVGRSIFDLEANRPGGGAVNVRVVGNITGAARNFWLANKGAGTDIRNIVFADNRMTEATGGLVFVYGPPSGYRGPYTFERNTLIAADRVHDEGSRGAFFLSRASDVTIRGNVVTFPIDRPVPAIESQDSINIVVEDNTFTNAGDLMITTKRA